MNKVSFVTSGNETVASYRYRVLAPAQFLNTHFISPTVDSQADPDAFAVIFSKHWTFNDWSYARFCKARGQKVFFDICDDHFEGNLAEHYNRMVSVADALICNSKSMQQRIKDVTGKDSAVIEDPVISIRQDYNKNKEFFALWYGQSMNIQGLYDVYTGNYPLEVAVPSPNIEPSESMTKGPVRWVQWNPGIIGEAAQRTSMALLPYRQGKEAKSANRVLEALWSGLPVITDPIPSVEELGKDGIRYLEQDCSNESIMEYMQSIDFTEEMQKAQKMIQSKYSPEAIASKWATVLKGGA